MSWWSVPPMIMAGITLYVGIYHLLIYLRRKQHREHLTFALMCLAMVLYDAFSAGLYQVSSASEGVRWQRLQVGTLAVVSVGLLWFITDYISQIAASFRRTTHRGLLGGISIFYALMALTEWVDRSSLSWLTDQPAVKQVSLPFGWEITYYEMTPGPLTNVLSICGFLLFLYVMWESVRLFRSGYRVQARPLILTMVLAFIAVFNDTAVSSGLYSFVYLIEYAYLAIVLLMTYVLSQGVVEAALIQHALRESEERFRSLVETTSDWIWETDAQGRYTYASPKVKELLGYEPAEILGRHGADLVAPSEVERVAALMHEIMVQRRPFHGLENVSRHRDGHLVILETSGIPVLDVQGNLLGYRGIDRDITKRKRVEEALRASEDKFRRIIESIPLGMHMYELHDDARLVFSGANPAADRILGLDHRQFVGKTIEEAFPALQQTGLPDRYREVALEGGRWHADQITHEEDRIAGAFDVYAFQTAPGRMVAAFLDVTERKRTEEDLRQRTAQMEALRKMSLDLTAQLDLDTLLHSIVMRAIELVGGTAGGLYLYRPERDILEWGLGIGPALPTVGTTLRRGEGLSGVILDTGEPLIVNDYWGWEGRSKKLDALPNVATVGAPVRWAGEYLGVLNIIHDVPHTFLSADAELLSLLATQAAIAMRNACLYEEAQQRADRLAVLNQIGQAVGTTLNLDDLLHTVYQNVSSIFSCDAFFIALYDEASGELDYRLQVDEGVLEPPDRRPVGTGLTSVVIQSQKPLLIVDLAKEQDALPLPLLWGSMKSPASWLGVPLRSGDRLVGVICVQAYETHAYDEEDLLLLSTIADQVAVAVEQARLYQTLRDSEEKYRALFEQANDAVFLEDLDGRVLEVNERACELLGYEREELLQLTTASLVPPEVQESLAEIAQDLARGRSMRVETDNLRKDGSRVAVGVSLAPLEIAGQQLVLALVHDITERKRLEEQLRQAQKMEAIGTLAGGIAHDFNNILTSILGYASLIRHELPDSRLQEDMETIMRSAERGANLTQQLLTFARRRQQTEMRSLNPNEVVGEVVQLLERTIDKAIAIQLQLAADAGPIRGDASQIHQLLLNLCLNARDAMPSGGQLTIESQNVYLTGEDVRTELGLAAGDYVVLSVTDTGVGMDASVRERLFEPFFTTKEHGRGLGLAMVYGIVRSHGGAIHVYSEPGEGTIVRVYLPAYMEVSEPVPATSASLPGGSETILVVDDEEDVRRLLQRILERAGYRVLLADDGMQAIDLYRRWMPQIDLVVLDMIMPYLGGQEAYRRLQEIHPQVKVLLSSGYSENGQAADILAAGAHGFLQKPYHLGTVLHTVRQVLDS